MLYRPHKEQPEARPDWLLKAAIIILLILGLVGAVCETLQITAPLTENARAH